jgi:hypothetical protein
MILLNLMVVASQNRYQSTISNAAPPQDATKQIGHVFPEPED